MIEFQSSKAAVDRKFIRQAMDPKGASSIFTLLLSHIFFGKLYLYIPMYVKKKELRNVFPQPRVCPLRHDTITPPFPGPVAFGFLLPYSYTLKGLTHRGELQECSIILSGKFEERSLQG